MLLVILFFLLQASSMVASLSLRLTRFLRSMLRNLTTNTWKNTYHLVLMKIKPRKYLWQRFSVKWSRASRDGSTSLTLLHQAVVTIHLLQLQLVLVHLYLQRWHLRHALRFVQSARVSQALRSQCFSLRLFSFMMRIFMVLERSLRMFSKLVLIALEKLCILIGFLLQERDILPACTKNTVR